MDDERGQRPFRKHEIERGKQRTGTAWLVALIGLGWERTYLIAFGGVWMR